jgi:aspartate racemase
MATIGIFGGMGPQASNKLCELIVSKALDRSVNRKDTSVPEIVLLNVPVPNFISNKKNMQIAESMLVKRVKIFDNANCDIAGIACNTAHLLLPAVQKHTKVPFVSLPNLVNERIVQISAKRVGLLATPTTLKSTLYDDALVGVEIDSSAG